MGIMEKMKVISALIAELGLTQQEVIDYLQKKEKEENPGVETPMEERERRTGLHRGYSDTDYDVGYY
ncbi:MAG: hypothetical protein IJ545_00320 [Alphaproteobacteria bacterium]|nr:hypothetical protein [Alphaproteobacteria bacterium]